MGTSLALLQSPSTIKQIVENILAKKSYGLQEQHSNSRLSIIKAHIINFLSTSQSETIDKAILDVNRELNILIQQRVVTHIVIYGYNRFAVAAKMLLSNKWPNDIKLLIVEKELNREELIAEKVDFKLQPEQISQLPECMSSQDLNNQIIPTSILKDLYANNKLVGPYQIDTDRYPFTNSFF